MHGGSRTLAKLFQKLELAHVGDLRPWCLFELPLSGALSQGSGFLLDWCKFLHDQRSFEISFILQEAFVAFLKTVRLENFRLVKLGGRRCTLTAT